MGGFLHPLLAFGVLAAAVPVIIHLLNRRRHKPMDWAAMRFAQLAWKRIRRRTRFENLFLLLLRCAAVALFALALARPLTKDGGLLAGLSQEQRELYVLLDGSASMGYRNDLESLWDRALAEARTRIEGLDGANGDRVHLYLVGDRPRRLSDRSPGDALSMLTSLEEPLAEGFDLGAALTRLVADMDERNVRGEAEILLLTDVQRSNFLRPDGALAPDAAEALDKLATRDAKVVVADVAPAFERRPDNLSVTDFVALDPFGDPLDAAGSSAPVLKDAQRALFVARVANSGDQAREVQVALSVDGERRPSRRVLVPALEAAEVELELGLDPGSIAKGGAYREVEVALEADALPIDDRRALVVHAPGPVGVLLVNGSPASDAESDELTYLRAALAPASETSSGSPFDVREITPDDSRIDALVEDADFVWLANVETPSATLAEALDRRVRAGATLVISLGDRVAASTYATSLGELLPVPLVERRGDPSHRTGFRRARIEAANHPALRFFRDERFELFFTEVPVFEYFHTERPVADAADVTVLASLDDTIGAGAPLLVQKALGQGQVYLWTTTIDTAWTLFPESPTSLIPLVHELAFDSARARGPERNLVVGEPLTARFDSFPENASLVEPGGAARRVDRAATELPAAAFGTWELVARDAADHPGIWRVTTNAAATSFAVTMDASEGHLERLPAEELGALSAVFVTSAPGEASTAGRNESGELYRFFLWLALAMLVGEALWSRYLAREVRA